MFCLKFGHSENEFNLGGNWYAQCCQCYRTRPLKSGDELKKPDIEPIELEAA